VNTIIEKFEEEQNLHIPATVWERWYNFSKGQLGYLITVLRTLEKMCEEKRKRDSLEGKLEFTVKEGTKLIFSYPVLMACKGWRTTIPLSKLQLVSKELQKEHEIATENAMETDSDHNYDRMEIDTDDVSPKTLLSLLPSTVTFFFLDSICNRSKIDCKRMCLHVDTPHC